MSEAKWKCDDCGEIGSGSTRHSCEIGREHQKQLAACDAEIAGLKSDLSKLHDEFDGYENRTSTGVHTCSEHCQRMNCILRRENTGLKSHAEETLALFKKFDCNWGCGCSMRHCLITEPCQSCRLQEFRSALAEAREVVAELHRAFAQHSKDNILPSGIIIRAAAWLAKGESR